MREPENNKLNGRTAAIPISTIKVSVKDIQEVIVSFRPTFTKKASRVVAPHQCARLHFKSEIIFYHCFSHPCIGIVWFKHNPGG